ncbi:MAG TPA: DnaJ domain-containing protein [Geminicoccus sp.]|jgi:curved DNA-binding protein CbpA|uniref:DnaJ domain-containing protein n=1 Tax=Geminicoccus sp. TaxID=2024832 RepID=UPI002E36D7D9|nr:DnaJ domain-containing protein [Geminicoccus sp.]HEX2526853.1 DnaJ domain-containing protein [Geminicoccus sp.]
MTGRGDPRGYYAALGLPLTASADDIRRAFGERAKQLHPDHAGSRGDPAAFQRVLDAYEVLRDPSRRLRYDADSVYMSRPEPTAADEPVAPDPLAPHWPVDAPVRAIPIPDARTLFLLGAVLALLLGAGSWIWAQSGEIAAYEARVAHLTVDLERAKSDQAEVLARYRAASVVELGQELAGDAALDAPAHLFATDLTFATESADLDPELDAQLVEAIRQVSAIVERLAPDRRWSVLIQGQAPQAATAGGVDVAGWQLSLLRIGQIIDRLVQAGFPADRLTMGFSAGFAAEHSGADPARTVELRVVCCLR